MGEERIYFFVRKGGASGGDSHLSTGSSGDVEIVRDFHAALSRLPDEDKKDLVDAIRHVPDLVEFESDPIKFLRREDFDADAAVKRLAAYWRNRRDIFGNRAFLPMTIQGGETAMRHEDIDFLQNGMHTVLQNHPDGRSVVFMNRTVNWNTRDSSTPEIRKRCFFYAHQVAAENKKSATDGIIILAYFTKIEFDPVSKACVRAVTESFPCKTEGHVFLNPCDESTFDRILANFASIAFRVVGTKNSRSVKLHLHTSSEALLAKLVDLGFRKEQIPDVLGGTLNHTSDWLSWMQWRALQESQRYPDDSLQQKPPAENRIVGGRTSQNPLEEAPLSEAQKQPQPASMQQQIMQQQDRSHGFLQQSSPAAALPAASGLPGNSSTASLPPMNTTPDAYALKGLMSRSAPETDDALERAQKAFGEALTVIHDDEKSAYFEALTKAPQIVKTESDPLRFLRVENYDPWKAARRLVMYWGFRKKIFGDAAFLPLKQTSGSALTSGDLLSAKTGQLAVLPRDAAGRQVVAFDNCRSLDGDINSEIRAMFYLTSVLAEDKANQIEGYVCIWCIMTPHRVKDFRPEATKQWVDLYHCMPVKVKACHMIMNPPSSQSSKRRAFVDGDLTRAVEISNASFAERAIIHRGRTGAELLEELGRYGLRDDGLPSAASGTWRYEQFKEWMRERARHEVSIARLDRIRAAQPNVGDDAAAAAAAASPSEHDGSDDNNEEDTATRKRRLNVLHSRQARERRRAEEATLREQYSHLTAANSELRRKNRLLESLLSDALLMVGTP